MISVSVPPAAYLSYGLCRVVCSSLSASLSASSLVVSLVVSLPVPFFENGPRLLRPIGPDDAREQHVQLCQLGFDRRTSVVVLVEIETPSKRQTAVVDEVKVDLVHGTADGGRTRQRFRSGGNVLPLVVCIVCRLPHCFCHGGVGVGGEYHAAHRMKGAIPHIH